MKNRLLFGNHKSRFYSKVNSSQDGDFSLVCNVCPRHCHLQTKQSGFCGVRKNEDNELVSLNYGLSTSFVVEPIETNGIFHYAPNAQTLAIGSVGCNFNCSYCQAWEYSRLKKIDPKHFHNVSPEQVIQTCKEMGLKFISWTFNDPMSWVEFVIDTARIGKKEGITSIFKSNHFMTEDVAQELLDCVDIYSISIKSIEEEFYRKISHGRLGPVLEIAKFFHGYGKHVEISNLVVPGKNDSDKQLRELALWIRDNLSADVPLHFARFHPDYKMLDVPRTPRETVERAQKITQGSILNYVYTGNIIHDSALNSYCKNCSSLLVERADGDIVVRNDDELYCDHCGRDLPIKQLHDFSDNKSEIEIFASKQEKYFWQNGVWSTDIELDNFSESTACLIIRYNDPFKDSENLVKQKMLVPAGKKIRFTINQKGKTNNSISVVFSEGCNLKFFDNPDRSYFGQIDNHNKENK